MRKTINVLYISHEGGLNGAPKSLLEYLPVIMTKGVNPIVVIPNKGCLYDTLRKKKIRTEVISYQQCVCLVKDTLEQQMNYITGNVKAVLSLCKLIHEEQIDIVHSNSFAVDIGAIAAYLCRKPHVWHLREYLEEDFGYQLKTPHITTFLLNKSVCRIAIANGIKNKYKQKYKVNAIRLYNGINKENYYQDKKINEKVTGRTNILIAGVISENKGQWDAIRAVEILYSKGMEIHLDIIGDGISTYVNKLRRYVREHNMLEYISFQKYIKDLQNIRLQSDIILTCSKMEAFGRVTAEAMMAGKIVIGTNSGGTQELIGEQEQRGYLYTYDCPQELARKIQYVIKHPEEKEKKEIEAQKFILQLTALDEYTDKLICIYNKILSK